MVQCKISVTGTEPGTQIQAPLSGLLSHGMKADRKETLRYLGYRGQQLDPGTAEMIEAIAAELEQGSSPKSVYQEYECKLFFKAHLLLLPAGIHNLSSYRDCTSPSDRIPSLLS